MTDRTSRSRHPGRAADECRRRRAWEDMAAALIMFDQTHGHVDVPRSYSTDESAHLGTWLHRQRALAATGALAPERRKRLEVIGVRWAVHDRTRGIVAFTAFRSANGHGMVPHALRTVGGFPLGTWVQSRRRQWALDPQATERLWPELMELGFVWRVRDNEDEWAAGIRALRSYREQRGDALVPHWFVTADGLALGRWVDSRRVEYRAGKLRTDRADELESLGMVWRLRDPADDASRARREAMHFAAVLRHAERWSQVNGGACPRARDVDEDGVAVGRWLVRQRQLYRERKMSSDRQQLLDRSIPQWRSGTSR